MAVPVLAGLRALAQTAANLPDPAFAALRLAFARFANETLANVKPSFTKTEGTKMRVTILAALLMHDQ
jgi:hypothetical protein